MHAILKKLTGGTRRSLGRTNEVVAEVLARPALFRHLFTGLTSDDEVLRMRAADAIEKITIPRPDLLIPFKKNFLNIANRTQQQEIRWHAALILPRLKLTATERAATIEILFDYLRDPSSIVKTYAMQALADFAASDLQLKSQIRSLLEELTQISTQPCAPAAANSSKTSNGLRPQNSTASQMRRTHPRVCRCCCRSPSF